MSKLSLYYPVKPNTVNQGFGGNGAYYQENNINIIGHNGIDFKASHGQPVYASHDGICYPEIDTTGGNGVVLISDITYDYDPNPVFMKTIYWHLTQDDAVVKTGQHVKAGEMIGYADSTGLSTGDHLHFGLKPVLASSEAPFAWETQNPNNGYLGAIDPTPYFNGLYAEDINTFTPFNTSLHVGQDSDEVRRLQSALRKLGFFNFPTDTGYYGTVTQSAVLNFQYYHNVVTFGIESGFGMFFGPKSCVALNNLLAGS